MIWLKKQKFHMLAFVVWIRLRACVTTLIFYMNEFRGACVYEQKKIDEGKHWNSGLVLIFIFMCKWIDILF
jgi:hypothetical protein